MKIFALLVVILMTAHADAFDRVNCQSQMKDWIVTLTDSTKSAVLTPFSQTVILSEELSSKLIIKNADTETVLTVFPWNSLYVRIPESTRKSFEVNSSETESGFHIEIKDKKSQVSRSLDCQFTF